MNVYVVRQADDDDYHPYERLLAVFSDRVTAEAYAKRERGQVDEFPLFDSVPEKVAVLNLGVPDDGYLREWVAQEDAVPTPPRVAVDHPREGWTYIEGTDFTAVWAKARELFPADLTYHPKNKERPGEKVWP